MIKSEHIRDTTHSSQTVYHKSKHKSQFLEQTNQQTIEHDRHSRISQHFRSEKANEPTLLTRFERWACGASWRSPPIRRPLAIAPRGAAVSDWPRSQLIIPSSGCIDLGCGGAAARSLNLDLLTCVWTAMTHVVFLGEGSQFFFFWKVWKMVQVIWSMSIV